MLRGSAAGRALRGPVPAPPPRRLASCCLSQQQQDRYPHKSNTPLTSMSSRKARHHFTSSITHQPKP